MQHASWLGALATSDLVSRGADESDSMALFSWAAGLTAIDRRAAGHIDGRTVYSSLTRRTAAPRSADGTSRAGVVG
jgi:hypothetical protein